MSTDERERQALAKCQEVLDVLHRTSNNLDSLQQTTTGISKALAEAKEHSGRLETLMKNDSDIQGDVLLRAKRRKELSKAYSDSRLRIQDVQDACRKATHSLMRLSAEARTRDDPYPTPQLIVESVSYRLPFTQYYVFKFDVLSFRLFSLLIH